MTRIFALNGASKSYINTADWSDQPDSQALVGATPTRRRRRHTWRAEIMPMAEFLAIQALEGERVSLTTTNYNDRNGDYVTYYGAEIDQASGRHESVNMVDVVVEFWVGV